MEIKNYRVNNHYNTEYVVLPSEIKYIYMADWIDVTVLTSRVLTKISDQLIGKFIGLCNALPHTKKKLTYDQYNKQKVKDLVDSEIKFLDYIVLNIHIAPYLVNGPYICYLLYVWELLDKMLPAIKKR